MLQVYLVPCTLPMIDFPLYDYCALRQFLNDSSALGQFMLYSNCVIIIKCQLCRKQFITLLVFALTKF